VREEFEQVFSQGELPEDMPALSLKGRRLNIIDALVDSKLTESKNEARRLIKQGGVYFDDKRIDKEDTLIDKEGIIKVGKRRFLRLKKN
jgi:tyrosyl-tRNA synthetase